jgi:hypothetical protein
MIVAYNVEQVVISALQRANRIDATMIPIGLAIPKRIVTNREGRVVT